MKADEVRKVVLSLLGWRLDFLPSGRVKLTSTYSSNSDTKPLALLFTSSAGDVGTMALLNDEEFGKEEGAEGIKEEVGRMSTYWVREKGSIPAFLASLQLTLLDRAERRS